MSRWAGTRFGSRLRIGAIVQARMGSRRLPGKALLRLAERPALTCLLERVSRARQVDALMVATTEESDDDAIALLCADRGVACRRGARDDVGARFEGVLREECFDAFVRLNGDSPFLDPDLIDRSVQLFREAGPDLVTTAAPRTFPCGQGVEVVRTDVFLRHRDDHGEPDEHVTGFLYRDPHRYRILGLRNHVDWTDVRLCLDSPSDFEVLSRLASLFEKPHWEYSLSDLVRLYRDAVALATTPPDVWPRVPCDSAKHLP